MKNKFILAASALAVALASSAIAEGTVNTNNAASGGRAGPAAGTMGSTANSSANTTTRPGNAKTTPGSSPNMNNNVNSNVAPSAGTTTDAGANAVTDLNGNQAANRGGPVNTVLPTGTGSYTYYADANAYYNPRTKVYYYQQNGEWKAGTTSPQGVTLGKGRTVQLQGESNVNGAGK